jgi:cardiolipin synthase A/B
MMRSAALGVPARLPPASVGMRVPADDGASFEQLLELYTGAHVEPGNDVEDLQNGDDTYDRLWRDLRAARSTITMQMYYAKPGRVSDTLAVVLEERARAGVRVLLLFDAFGAQAMSRSWMTRLRRGGVDVRLLRSLRWYTIHSATDRSHVRAVVIDGRVGYTGGFGFADYWLGGGHVRSEWRESNVRFAGPAVRGLQAAFAAAWAEATQELITDERFFPNDSVRGSVSSRAAVLFTTPTTGSTSAERFLALAIRSARRRLFITNAYFVPNAHLRRLLEDAADRGVDVRVVTAGSKTDVKTPWLAGRYHYPELVEHAIRVYEFQPAMMHAKTMVVDDDWATIGSMNFDSHSLAFNNEVNLVVFDRSFAAHMDSVFFDDLRCAREMTSRVLAERPWWELLLERGASMLSRFL